MSEENISLPVAQALASALEKIEAYVPTEYVDNSEPDIDAEHLNHAEQGIMRVTNLLNAAVDVIQGQESRILDAETKIGNAETKIGTAVLTGGMTDLSSGVNSLYSNLDSSYFKMRVKNTIIALMVEECTFTNGIAYKSLESIFGKTPSFVGGVCQASADGNYFFTATKDGANLKIIMSNLSFSGKYWITAIIVGTL